MDSEKHLEFIKTYLPKYLTPDQQTDLFKVIKEDFPYSINSERLFTEQIDDSYIYQGDGIEDIPFSELNISKGDFETLYMPGAVMSNTCDIANKNDRLQQPLIQFASIYKLNDYLKELKTQKVSKERVDSFVSTLKANRISNMFYLPEKKTDNKLIIEESFIRFDLNITLSSDIFKNKRYNLSYFPTGDRFFTFSNYGFYLFLVKLSIHYCRFREGVFRDNLN